MLNFPCLKNKINLLRKMSDTSENETLELQA